MKLIAGAIAALSALALATAAAAQPGPTNDPSGRAAYDYVRDGFRMLCINPTTKIPESCGSTVSGGTFNTAATATAADPANSEGATNAPLSVDLAGYLRVKAKIADGADVAKGAKADAAWDGSAGSASQIAIEKYSAAKDEAIRALLAGTLTVQGTVTANIGTGGSLATATKQPALGTVGTPSADVITTQTADLRPASSTITAADAATTTTTGQSSVVLVSGTPTANSFQTQALNGASSATITTTGTFVATDQIEASYDGATTYVPVKGLLRGTNILTSSITGPGVVSLDVTGATNLRVRATNYTSGTETVKIAISNAPGMAKVLNGIHFVDANGADVDVSAAGNGIGPNGSTGPANSVQIGVTMNGVLTTPIGCDKSIVYDASTSGETQLVAASGSTVIYVCGYTMFTPGTVNVNLASADTGGSCANPVKLTPAFQLTAQSGAVDGSPFYRGLKTPSGKALCWNASAGVAGQGVVYYAQF